MNSVSCTQKPLSNIDEVSITLETGGPFRATALENPDIEGVEYQQGQLAGCEVREYVLLKWNHQCAYCDAREIPLELDHI